MLGFKFNTTFQALGIGIVAILAFEIAALQEYYQSYPWPFMGTKGFYRMNAKHIKSTQRRFWLGLLAGVGGIV